MTVGVAKNSKQTTTKSQDSRSDFKFPLRRVPSHSQFSCPHNYRKAQKSNFLRLSTWYSSEAMVQSKNAVLSCSIL